MSVSRRIFLGAACASGAATAARASGAPSPNAVDGGPRESLGMLTDLSLCVGCRKCEWACDEANGQAIGGPEAYESTAVFDSARRTGPTRFTIVNRYTPEESIDPVHVKEQCMHCLDPACVSACPVKALHKTADGAVLYNEKLCIGCRYCMIACPFDVPAYEYADPFTPKVRKCTRCHDKYAETGEAPACASVCPQEAITFGPRDKLLTLARTKIAEQPGRYVDHVYGEREAGGTNWMYVSPAPFAKLGFRTNLREKSYPDLTKGFLSLVPMVHAIWPMLLVGIYAFTGRGKAHPQPVSVSSEEESN